jgi:hypothetical protein
MSPEIDCSIIWGVAEASRGEGGSSCLQYYHTSSSLSGNIWEQFAVLLPERNVDHPLGCHRPRIPNRVVFNKLVQVLVFGCAYWRYLGG